MTSHCRLSKSWYPLLVLLVSLPVLADSEDQLRGAGANAVDWLTYGHGYANQRHSVLQQIHRGNVSRLVPKWIYQTGVDGTFQTNPIVLDGVVYLTTPRNHIVALDGVMRWFHQVTPHDIWGYDLSSSPMLIDVPANGKTLPGIALATKSGWMYFFNRITGEVIRRSDGFVPQSNLFQRAKDAKGVTAVPGEAGGANWPPIAFSPDTGWAYVAGSHFPSQFTLEPDAKGNLVNVLSFPKGAETYGTVSAIDPASGKLVWQDRMSKPFNGGITTTAGGLVFMGESDGHFTARDTRTGKLLWRFQTGAGVNAPPVVYETGGKEYVVVAAGGNKLFNMPPGNAVIGFGLYEQNAE